MARPNTFLYWCRPCDGWWDAEIPTDLRERLQRYQIHSYLKPGTWAHPGQPVCPGCGQIATQYLPTEFFPVRGHDPKRVNRIVDSEPVTA